ncbi:MAG: Gfo/Idh/MocA family oxidoreductase [Candidatus Saccharicenans sp.]|nr:Gfo/Idh/MocA family oxidoreductase [Candidatus Saccharicenans sp.]
MKNFALIGVAGYIAPRHLKAIKETNNQLVATLDKSDSVGIIDSYFANADFFTEFERFDRHLEMLRRKEPERAVHFVSICSPNYLHDAHCRFALRIGADAICEKPVVLNPWNIDALKEEEEEYGHKIYTVLQLRLHPEILNLREKIEQNRSDSIYDIDLTYITARGRWYFYSWKGIEDKSGGIATNIGVHFFDMLSWIFGPPLRNIVHLRQPDVAAGYLELKKARVRWFLSLRFEDLPPEVLSAGKRSYRCIEINGKPFDFTDGFQDLHTRVYEEILKGNGFRLDENRNAIDIVYQIRKTELKPRAGDVHPLAAKLL